MIFTLVYLTVAVLTVYPAYRVISEDFHEEAGDRALFGFLACFASALWPIFLTAFLAFRASRWFWTRSFGLDNEEVKR
jgi:hypothetical protein